MPSGIYKRTEESKKKTSKTLTGISYITEKGREKLSRIMKGKRVRGIGWHHSTETRKKISESHKGEKCYNYKGGISKEPY